MTYVYVIHYDSFNFFGRELKNINNLFLLCAVPLNAILTKWNAVENRLDEGNKTRKNTGLSTHEMTFTSLTV